MLETLIKRDGSEEPFIADKPLKWLTWGSADLRDRVNFGKALRNAVASCGVKEKTQDFQLKVINELIAEADWAHSLFAGKLYSVWLHKKIHGNKIPTVAQKMAELYADGLGIWMNYSERDLETIETFIDHGRDHNMAEFQLQYIRHKYSIRNEVTGKEYETPQFVYMRMAMHLAEVSDPEVRLIDVKNWYDHFSEFRISAPTPNFTNLGTSHRGLASCCLLVAGDSIGSLDAARSILYKMTANHAGIGYHLDTRSFDDPVRGGRILHQGKIPYHNDMGAGVKANKQGTRGGAATGYGLAFDPEIVPMIMMQNHRTAEEKRVRTINWAMTGNAFVAYKASLEDEKDRQIFLFNSFTAPDLYKAMFGPRIDQFIELYNKYEADENFKKTYMDARQIVILMQTQGFEVGTAFLFFADEANRHTPFKDPIHSSNLCTEIMQPAAPYQSVMDLYTMEDHGRGEVSMCSLGGIVHSMCKTIAQLRSASYYVLKMIDRCIDMSTYPFPHVEMTTKARMNAGVGIVGLAHYMAERGLPYDTVEGRNEIHRVAERHSYYLIEASLRLAKERGLPKWIHKTKWPEGWLPIDTYKKHVDTCVTVGLECDWETLRADIIATGGIGHSVLVQHMPTESSSKAVGLPNSHLPIRSFVMIKNDGSKAVDWFPRDGDLLKDKYQLAFSIKTTHQIQYYGLIQKFSDGGSSNDIYKDRSEDINIYTADMVQDYVDLVRYGCKSRYYVNSNVSAKDQKAAAEAVAVAAEEAERGCGSGGCQL